MLQSKLKIFNVPEIVARGNVIFRIFVVQSAERIFWNAETFWEVQVTTPVNENPYNTTL